MLNFNHLILCHQTADFDALGAAVGLSCLYPGAKIVLAGGAHRAVKEFLALHRDELAIIEHRSVNPHLIHSLSIVDTQKRDRLGSLSHWLDLPQLKSISVYDHHPGFESDIPATYRQIESVGATTTLIVEELSKHNLKPNAFEATTMALGIHVDTGSLTFENSTPRDASALAWLMAFGANVKTIAEYVSPSLPPLLQDLLSDALSLLETSTIRSYKVSAVILSGNDFVSGLSMLIGRIMDAIDCDAFILGHYYSKLKPTNTKKKDNFSNSNSPKTKLSIIGRSRIPSTFLNQIFAEYGGGGHSQAASAMISTDNPEKIFTQILTQFKNQIPHPPNARDLMSSPVRTIRPHITIEEAQRILLRYGHSGLFVVNEKDELVGVISRRDLDLALHHQFSHAPVKGYMSSNIKTITPETSLSEIESLMVNNDIGRLPVLDSGNLVGIVTRTDVLRQLHQEGGKLEQERKQAQISCLLPTIRHKLKSSIWNLLEIASQEAEKRGWHLYLVGGAVRDLLLMNEEETSLELQDIDLVVDSFENTVKTGAGVELANSLQQAYPDVRLSVHGEFKTAALLWHNHPEFGSLWVDIATSRTEFYPYPAANPQVEASSIRQDLYRRDFTINALAVRLTSPKEGELLDFFGGVTDLRKGLVRVLHANSFIEDPTRIYRAVKFAVRLGFELESETRGYIEYAISSGVYQRVSQQNQPIPALRTRLKAELKYILEASYWQNALKLLSSINALSCLHPNLKLDRHLWWQFRYVSRWLKLFSGEYNFPDWLIRLEVLIGAIPANDREKVAINLELPKDSIERLKGLDTLESEVIKGLSEVNLVSEKVKLLRQFLGGKGNNNLLPNILLLVVRCPRNIRRILWNYYTIWSKVKAPLNGKDLKAFGYKPSPVFSSILDALLAKTLDGEIVDRPDAERFLRDNYGELGNK